MTGLYDPQRKETFLAEQLPDNHIQQKQCRYLFSRLANAEETYQADLSTFNEDRLKAALESIAGLRNESQNMTLRYLRLYVTWCRNSGFPDVSDAVFKVRVEGLERMRERTVCGPDHLQRCLDEIFEPEDEKTVDITFRAFFWLAFAGMDEEDILQIRGTDLDFDRMVAVYGRTEYPFPPQAVFSLQVAAKLPVFKFRHPNYKSDVYRDRAEGTSLIRGFRNVALITSYRNILSRKMREAQKDGRTETNLSYARVWLSGLFWRAYEREKAGETVDFREEAERFTTRRKDKDGNAIPYTLISLEHKRHDVMRDYAADYQRWKQAWGLL